MQEGQEGPLGGGGSPGFGLLQGSGEVCVVMVSDAPSKALAPRENRSASIVCTDRDKLYDVLAVSEFHHHRINRSQCFMDRGTHINGIEILLEPGQTPVEALS